MKEADLIEVGLRFLQPHAGRGAKGRQDRTRDGYNNLRNKLCGFFLTHNSLNFNLMFLSLLILGTVPRLNCPQVEV